MHDDTNHADNPRMRPEPTGFYGRAIWEAECRVEVARDLLRAAAESYQITDSWEDYVAARGAQLVFDNAQRNLLAARMR